MLDEEKELQKSKFPIPPEDLISLAKAYIVSASEGEPERWLADDFRFVAPVVGPFGKDEFIDSLKSFELLKGFPDLSSNFHHFRVDPFEPDRVWYSVKFIGSNTGPIMGRPATGKAVESPVQAQSLTFNEQGQITKFTIGYVLDKETGNTGGLGGVFGLLYGIGYGLPFPEAQPYQPSPIYGTLMQGNRAIQDLFKANPSAKNAIQGFLTSIGK
jgi:predicted ester cyclase